MMFICFHTACDMLWLSWSVFDSWVKHSPYSPKYQTPSQVCCGRGHESDIPHIFHDATSSPVSVNLRACWTLRMVQWNANVWLQQNHPKDDHGKCWFLWNSVDVPVRTYLSHGSGVRIKAIWSWCRHAIDFQWNGPKESCRFPRSRVKHAQVQSGWSFWVMGTVMFGWDERN
jgi:hypothetical protein